MKKVKITKLKSVENPVYPTADYNDYKPGEYNGNVSLPNEYWIEGHIMNEITLGSSVLVNRTSRNGVLCGGTFLTSKVTKITENGFETQNSVYQVDYLEKEID